MSVCGDISHTLVSLSLLLASVVMMEIKLTAGIMQIIPRGLQYMNAICKTLVKFSGPLLNSLHALFQSKTAWEVMFVVDKSCPHSY